MSRHKRDLSQYLTRRRVKDVKAWIQAQGISDYASFLAWCDSRDMHLSFSEQHCQSHFFAKQQTPNVTAEAKTLEVIDPTTGEVEGSWHTPAAERPLKKRKKQTTKARNTRKQKSKK